MAVSRPDHLHRLEEGPRPGADEGLAADDVRAPGALLMAMEGRAPLEIVAGFAARPWLKQVERGDGHAVVVFPGLGASDLSTLPLRRFLASRGYDVRGWGGGLNLGPREGVLDACRALVRDAAGRDERPVSLVGWSLGGIYARELAKEMPHLVRAVVTLGSPFSGPPQATNAWRLFELVSGQSAATHALRDQLHVPPPVPTTSIYSRTDGVVAWPCSLNVPGPLTENVEVRASHLGMAAHPVVQFVVADRLRQDPTEWKPYDAQRARRWFLDVATPRVFPFRAAA
jgi:pimeloyl-ACP methyl ester carboxylesterase